MKKYPEVAGIHTRKQAHRKTLAGKPVAEKMASVSALREAERILLPARAANKARRTAKLVKVRIKTA